MYIADCIKGTERTAVSRADQSKTQAEEKEARQETSVVVDLSQEGIRLSGRKQEAVSESSLWEKMLEQSKQEQMAFSRMFCKTKSAEKKKKKISGSTVAKALAIARRIMRGDKVPPKDESFLFRYNSDLYLKAKTMAMQNQKPKKHKSLLEEKEERGGICSCLVSTNEGAVDSSGDSEESEE